MVFWLDEPSSLFTQENYLKVVPDDTMGETEKLNAVMRLSIYLGLVGSLLMNCSNWLYLPILVAGITVYLHRNKGLMGNEGLMGLMGQSDNEGFALRDNVKESEFIRPTPENPFGNFNQITDPRDRPPAMKSFDNPEIRREMKDNFERNLFKDAGDLFDKANGQRQFYQMPSTESAPDTIAFAKYLYGTDPTCKENNTYCAPYYDPLE
jgi:hypothetical protein